MDDDQSEKKEVSQPAGTGLKEGTKEGAFMVIGTVEKTLELLQKLKMPDVELMPRGNWVQRTWFAAVPSSPLLEMAIAAAAAGKWIIASLDGCDVRWRFEMKGAPPPKGNQRQSPTKPSVMPSVAPQRAAGVPPSGAWQQPFRYTPQPVHPNVLSKEAVSALIKEEIASRLAQYDQQLAAAKAEAKRQKAELRDKEAEIDSLKKELAAVKDQAKSSAIPAAASSPPDMQCPPEKQAQWWWQRDVRDLTKDVKEVVQKCTAVQVDQTRRDHDVAVIRQSLSALQRQLDALQQLTMSAREDRPSQLENRPRATQLPSRSRGSGPTDAVVVPPTTFVFGGKVYQQPLPEVKWPACPEGGFVFGRHEAPAAVAPELPEDETESASERPPDEIGEEGEADEEKGEVEQKQEEMLQVTVKLASGGPTPTKPPPPVVNVRACSKSPPVRSTRVRSPGDTPSRDEVLRQNAADPMAGVDADAAKWAVVVSRPKEVRELSAAKEFEREEAARLVRRPLFEDQNCRAV
jgi:hypothetical protein